MDWKGHISKFGGKMTKEKWLFLLLLGVLLMILSFPLPGGERSEKKKNVKAQSSEAGFGTGAVPLWTGESHASGTGNGGQEGDFGSSDGQEASPVAAPVGKEGSYEAQLEARIKDILKSVEGVGKVDVMVVLKSSSEKVVRVDRSTSTNTTQERDSGGGARDVTSSQMEENTVLAGSGTGTGGNSPIIEKEISPEISGIIISAEGGGSGAVKTEISQAMEALFGLPPHKIKVLKRVE